MLNSVVLGILIRTSRARIRTENYIRKREKVISHKLKTVTKEFESKIKRLKGQLGSVVTAYNQLSIENSEILKFVVNTTEKTQALNYSNDGITVEIARQIGEEISLSNEEMRDLTVAAICRDIGKIELPKQIRKLHHEELKDRQKVTYEQHPDIGAKMMRAVTGFEKIASAIETHHENFDGTGYPQGMHTVDLPVINKILRIAVGINNFRDRNKRDNEDDWQVGLRHLNSYAELLYDPEISKVASEATIEIERKQGDYVVKEVEIADLEDGHRLAEDILQANETYLLRQGKALNKSLIKRLKTEIKQTDRSDKVRVFIEESKD